jgi:hypothetical protein
MGAVMQQFLCVHTAAPGAISRARLEQFTEAAQHDADVRGYRSFMSPSKGKLVCILEAPDDAVVASWFHNMGLPVDTSRVWSLRGSARDRAGGGDDARGGVGCFARGDMPH